MTDAALAVIVIEPARAPVMLADAIPPDATAVPRPVTVPAPLVFANVTTVVLSPLTRLPAPSRSSAVSVREEPEARPAVELVKARWAGAPGPIVNVVVPEVREPAEAVIVTGPASTPVTAVVATPPDAVAEPSPVTVPAPAVFANVTLVALSVISTFPNASRTSTFSCREAPDATLAVELVKVRWSASAGLTVSAFESTAIAPVPPLPLVSALVARSVLASAELSIRRLAKTATPFTAATVAVPCSVPLPLCRLIVMLALASGPVVTVLPLGSLTTTVGCVKKAEPAVAPPGCDEKTRWSATSTAL